jgi:hypothetical protein
MASGSMWWMKHELVTRLPQTVTTSWDPNGLRLAGSMTGLGGTLGGISADVGPWWFELTSYYFLDIARMPATGEPFVSLPQVRFIGNVALSGGPNANPGWASCSVRITQSLRPGGIELDAPFAGWNVGSVAGGKLSVFGGPGFLKPPQRDYPALLFNLDRSQTLVIRTVTRFDFSASLLGVIVFTPLVVGTPQWSIYSLD